MRKIVRPRRRWKYKSKMAISETKPENVDWVDLAQNNVLVGHNSWPLWRLLIIGEHCNHFTRFEILHALTLSGK